jgi:hypothetical protein
MAFSCGARSALNLKEQGYLRSMLSRRQLQGFVMPMWWVAMFDYRARFAAMDATSSST